MVTPRKPKSKHKKSGPPPQPIDLVLVERLAQRQGSTREIAACLGMSEGALRLRVKKDKALREAIKRGRATGCMTLRTRLFNLAMEGNPAALIFAAKNHLGMTDKVATEVSGKNGGPVQVQNTWLDLVKSAHAKKTAGDK